jgi:LPXTG-motif cell wall-anchored protein
MEMEQSWMTGMELEQSWIIAGGVGAVLLIALVWFLLRRRSKGESGAEADQGHDAEIRLTEPTLEPLPDVSGDTEPTATDSVPPTETVGEAAEPETEPTPVTAHEFEPAPEPASEAELETEPEPSSEPAPAEAGEAPAQADAPEAPPVTDPAFLAAREAFARELLAGNFSRLDVFEAYAEAQQGPKAPAVPRSEFFHRVVNQALETRDAFEALLSKEHREQFVDIHSRYLDDVTAEADADVRERLHREHREKLDSLRPQPAESG